MPQITCFWRRLINKTHKTQFKQENKRLSPVLALLQTLYYSESLEMLKLSILLIFSECLYDVVAELQRCTPLDL